MPRQEVEAKISRWLARKADGQASYGLRRRTPEEIVEALRHADRQLAQGKTREKVLRKLGISPETFARWQKEYAGLSENEAVRLKNLRTENTKLRKAVTNLAVEKLMVDEQDEGMDQKKA